jgi:hypothetical protein
VPGQAPVPGIGGDGRVGHFELVAALSVPLRRGGLGVDLDPRVPRRPRGPHVGDGANLVDAAQAPDETDVLGGGDPPFRAFQPLVARGQVEGHAPVPAVEEQGRAGGLDAAEVVEGVRLAGELETVREGHALGDGDRFVSDAVEDGVPPCAELLRREVRLEVLSRRGGRTEKRQRECGSEANVWSHAGLRRAQSSGARAPLAYMLRPDTSEHDAAPAWRRSSASCTINRNARLRW